MTLVPRLARWLAQVCSAMCQPAGLGYSEFWGRQCIKVGQTVLFDLLIGLGQAGWMSTRGWRLQPAAAQCHLCDQRSALELILKDNKSFTCDQS